MPGAVLTNLLDLLGQGQQVLTLITYVALAMAGLSGALSLYGAVLARMRDIAVLRLALGLTLGYAISFGTAWFVRQRSAIAVVLGVESGQSLIRRLCLPWPACWAATRPASLSGQPYYYSRRRMTILQR